MQTEPYPIVIATTGYTQEQIDQIKESKEIPVFFTLICLWGLIYWWDLAKESGCCLGEISSISEIIENTITKR